VWKFYVWQLQEAAQSSLSQAPRPLPAGAECSTFLAAREQQQQQIFPQRVLQHSAMHTAAASGGRQQGTHTRMRAHTQPCVNMHVCTHAHTRTYTHARTHTHTQKHTHIRAHTQHTHVRVNTHTHTKTHIQINTIMRMHARTHCIDSTYWALPAFQRRFPLVQQKAHRPYINGRLLPL